MKDLRFTYLIDVIQTDSISELAGVVPRTLEAQGAELYRTSEIRINGLTSPLVEILTATKILFQVPSALQSIPISQLAIRILATGHKVGEEQQIVLDLATSPKAVEGLESLVQKVVKLLLTTAGTDRFFPSSGGSLMQIAGTSLTSANSAEIKASIQEAIQRTEEQLINSQVTISGLSPSERLKSLRSGTISVDATTGSVTLDIRITSNAGTTQSLPIVVGNN